MIKGSAIIVDDAPGARGQIAEWLSQLKYKCVFVDSERDAKSVSSKFLTDTIFRASNFEFAANYTLLKPH